MMEENISYTEAYEKLQDIIAQLESEEITIDTLAENISLAANYLKICQSKLASTEKEIDDLVKEMTPAGY